MIHFILQHEFWSGVAGYWILSAAVSAMPEPVTDSTEGYVWLYKFAHTIAGNITTVFSNKIPGLK